MTALELIDTKDILTNEEYEIVLAFDKQLVVKHLFNLENGSWLNTNVYSEREHDERQFRMEIGY